MRKIAMVMMLSFVTTSLFAGFFSKGKSFVEKNKPTTKKEEKKKEAPKKVQKKTIVKEEKPKEHPNMAKSGLKTYIGQLKKFCPLDQKILSDLKRCKNVIGYAQKRIDRTEELNRSLAEFKEISTLKEQVEKNIPVWEKNQADAKAAKQEARQQSDRFRKAVRNHGIQNLFWSVKNGDKFYTNPDPKRLISDYKKGQALEAEFLAPCKNGEFKYATTFSRKGSAGTVEAVCHLAENWKTYFDTYMTKSLKQREEQLAKNLAYDLKKIAETGMVYPSSFKKMKNTKKFVDGLRKNYTELYTTIGKEMPTELFMPVIEATKDFKKVVKKSGKVRRWNKKNRYKNGSVSAAFKRALKGQKLSLKRIGLVAPNWLIKKNHYGIPTSRLRTGDLLVKARGEKYCRIYTINAKAQYSGGGKYGRPVAHLEKERERYIISKCK